MLLPANYNFSLARGKTFSLKFVQKDGAGVPADLSGLKARAEFRELDGQYGTTGVSTLLLALADGDGIAVTDALAGEVTLDVSAARTLLLNEANEPGGVAYEIELYDDTGSEPIVHGFLMGAVNVIPETSRSAMP